MIGIEILVSKEWINFGPPTSPKIFISYRLRQPPYHKDHGSCSFDEVSSTSMSEVPDQGE
jgi:hypothetical protein